MSGVVGIFAYFTAKWQEEKKLKWLRLYPSFTPFMSVTKSLPQDLLLIVFIHGYLNTSQIVAAPFTDRQPRFRGGEDTFLDFPARLNHVLSETVKDLIVECVVFPAYETRGELAEAVARLSDWLLKLTKEKEAAANVKVKVALCGHRSA